MPRLQSDLSLPLTVTNIIKGFIIFYDDMIGFQVTLLVLEKIYCLVCYKYGIWF